MGVKRPSTPVGSAKKKARKEGASLVKQHIQTLVRAFDDEDEYEFPCRELLCSLIPVVLERPVEDRHEFQLRTSEMITEAIKEASTKLKFREVKLQKTVDNSDQVKADFERKVETCTGEIARLEGKITETDTTIAEVSKKLVEDERIHREESTKVRDHEVRYQSYQDDLALLTKTLEEFNQVIETPPELKRDQFKHQSGFERVFKRFFAGEKTLLAAIVTVLTKAVAPTELGEFDKVSIGEVQRILENEKNAFEVKIRDDVPDTRAKVAAATEVENSVVHKDEVIAELRELRHELREVTKAKKDAETMVRTHPQNVKQWERDLSRLQITIGEFTDTVVASHDFLINRSEEIIIEVPPEPVEETPIVTEGIVEEREVPTTYEQNFPDVEATAAVTHVAPTLSPEKVAMLSSDAYEPNLELTPSPTRTGSHCQSWEF